MNAEQLRNAIWKMDDKFIAEAETYEPETTRSTKPIWIITSASAAVIALCTCIHYHNAVNQALNPEIDNTVVITTTVSETEAYETEAVKTEKPVLISEPVSENTEVTETETGFESSVPDAATVPEKTEAPSGNGGNSGEKTVVTQKPQDVTKTPVTETAEVTSEVQTDEPVTEPVATDITAETKPYVNPNEGPLPVSPATEIVMTENPVTEPSDVPDQTYPFNTNPAPIPHEMVEYSEVSVDCFPEYLIDSDGVRYERDEIISSDTVGKFVKQEDFTDDYGNTYNFNVYLLNDFNADNVWVIHFSTPGYYISYIKDMNS